jgi:hypothetical protein
MRLFWIKQLVCLMKKKSYTIVCMKLILVKLIACGLPWTLPLFPSTMNAVYKFPLMWEKFTYTLYHFYDRGKYVWLKPLKALFICWSAVDILSFCSLRSAGNNHCNVQWKQIRIKKNPCFYIAKQTKTAIILTFFKTNLFIG